MPIYDELRSKAERLLLGGTAISASRSKPTELILDRGPDRWVHRHIHYASDHIVCRTRLVCNARGHLDEVTGILPDKVVEVDLAAEPYGDSASSA